MDTAGEVDKPVQVPNDNNDNKSARKDTMDKHKPYSSWFHPEKTWKDIIISFVMRFLLPLAKLKNYSPSASETSLKFLEKQRSVFFKIEQSGLPSKIAGWSKAAKCSIVECVQTIPRNDKILKLWGIVNDDIKCQLPSEDITIITRFPASLLPDDVKTSNDETKSGCVQVESIDFYKLPLDAPIILSFHGGGLVSGSAHSELASVESAQGMAQDYLEKLPKAFQSSKRPPPLVIVSVEYSLAPEYPFPAAIIDALSVVEFLLDGNPSRKIHIGGVSAGGYLALVAGFEAFRKYPGRISSIYLLAPMVSPSADSRTYFLNSTSSGCCPVEFVRWGWQAYLRMDPDSEKTDETNHRNDDHNIFRKNSNYGLWMKSLWRSNPSMRRLIEPMFDIPTRLDAEDAPQFVIGLNTADPLYAEGLELTQSLQQRHNAKVSFVQAKGSHVFGYQFDSKAEKQRRDLLAAALWGK